MTVAVDNGVFAKKALLHSSRSITVINPQVGDRVSLGKTARELNLSRIQSVLVGTTSPTVSFSLIQTGTGSGTFEYVMSNTTCSNTTTGVGTTTFNYDGYIFPNNYMYINIDDVLGSVDQISVTVIF